MNTTDFYLEALERQINPAVEEELLEQWEVFWRGETGAEFFSPVRAPSPLTAKWPAIKINDAIEDQKVMLLRELAGCAGVLASERGLTPNIRCNYGTGILPSLFGTNLFMMDHGLDTLPSAKPLGREVIPSLLNAGIPDLNSGLGSKVWETAAYYKEALKPYPEAGRFIHVYHPDLQGPLDVLELVWGSDFFLDIYDEPQLVKEFLELITDTYIAFMKKWISLFGAEGDFSAHWGMWIKGQITLRNDSAVNMSGDMYEEFVRPFDERILNEFGGGIIHYCGKGDHFVKAMCDMPRCYGIHLSQPHLNNMDVVLNGSIEQGKRILWLEKTCADQLQKQGRNLKGLVCLGTGNL